MNLNSWWDTSNRASRVFTRGNLIPQKLSPELHFNTLAFKSDFLSFKNPLENYLFRSSRRFYKQYQQIHKTNDVVEDYEGLSRHYEQLQEQQGLF